MTTAVTSDREPLADSDQLADYLRIPVRTLEEWRRAGKGPKWTVVGRHVRYTWPDVDAWLASQSRGGAS